MSLLPTKIIISLSIYFLESAVDRIALSNLLYIGNKKVKHVGKIASDIWLFLNQGESLDTSLLSIPSEVGDCWYDSCNLRELKEACFDIEKSYLFDYDEDDEEYASFSAFATINNCIEDLKNQKDEMRSQVQDFYSIKNKICLEMMKPIGYHIIITDKYIYDNENETGYFKTINCALFEFCGHTFHTPFDKLPDDFDFDSLEFLGEIDEIPTDIEHQTAYNDLSLTEIIELLRKHVQ